MAGASRRRDADGSLARLCGRDEQQGAQEQLRMAAASRWLENDLVFSGPIGGPIPPGSVTRRFAALLGAAGLGRLRFHDLRHAAATVMLAQGVELRVISETLGHNFARHDSGCLCRRRSRTWSCGCGQDG